MTIVMKDLINRLRLLSLNQHDDLSVGDEAADALEAYALRDSAYDLIERLHSHAQNEEMVDSHYTHVGRLMNEAAEMINRLISLRPL